MAVNYGHAEIISVGNELLMGRTVNTSAAFLAERLLKLGFEVKHQVTVADDETEIIAALRTAVSRSAVVILTGGLGPTEDDLTKETVAKVLGMPMELDETILADIKAFFESRGREMEDNNIKQALVPRGAKALRNANGTAPGIYIGTKSQAIVLLPGPPRELEPLFDNETAPILARLSTKTVLNKTIGVAGIGESELEMKIKELLYRDNPHCALYAKEGEVQVSMTATADDEEQARVLLDDSLSALRELLGDCIFDENGRSLCQSVVAQLMEEKKQVALAESCTGGMMAKQITDIPGSSAVFQYGIASYSDRVKSSSLDVDRELLRKFSAVSSPVAGEMARGARRNGKADYGVGITGLAGPGSSYYDKPVGLVFISVCDGEKTLVKQFNFGDKRDRDNIRRLSVVNAFDMLRRLMNGMPVDGAYEFVKGQITDVDSYQAPKKKAGLLFKKAVSSVLVLALMGSLLNFGVQRTAAAVRKSTYTELSRKYEHVIQTEGSAGVKELFSKYASCIGWLSNTNGDISTVTVTGRTDDYYSARDYRGKKNLLGCCSVQSGTDMDEIPENLCITSYTDEDGIMLGSLEKYLDPEYAADNCLFCYCGKDFKEYYRLCSVFLTDTEEKIDKLISSPYFKDKTEKEEFIINAKLRSMYETDDALLSSDRFLTLIRDIDNVYEGCRMVVIAKSCGSKAVAGAQMNLAVSDGYLNPVKWYEINGREPNINVTARKDYWYEWLLRNDSEAEGREYLLEFEEKHLRVIMNGETYEATPLAVISRMVAAKVDDSFNTNAIKAISMATQSQLKHEMLQGLTPEVKGAEPTEYITEIVASVLNRVITYNGEVAWTPTTYCTYGTTNSAAEMWGSDFQYLRSVKSAYDHLAGSNGYTSSGGYELSELRDIIEKRYGIVLSDEVENWINVTSTTTAGYAAKVSIDGQVEVGGEEFFMDLLGLKSPNVSITLYSDTVEFHVYGTGNGVGLSIVGANKYEYAMKWGYEQMIDHYFPGTSLGVEYWDPYYCN